MKCPYCGYESPPAGSERNRRLMERYARGDVTMKQLGNEFGLSGGRVRQIIIDEQYRMEREKKSLLARQGASTIDDLPIDAIGLPTAALNALRNALRWDYKTVGEVRKLTDFELLRIPNFGRVSLHAWKQALRRLENERGIRLSKTPEPFRQSAENRNDIKGEI
jgi:DNA-directed RNA polymerase alpha subunit